MIENYSHWFLIAIWMNIIIIWTVFSTIISKDSLHVCEQVYFTQAPFFSPFYPLKPNFTRTHLCCPAKPPLLSCKRIRFFQVEMPGHLEVPTSHWTRPSILIIHRLLQYLENYRTVKFKDHKESRHMYINSLKVKRPTKHGKYNFNSKRGKDNILLCSKDLKIERQIWQR